MGDEKSERADESGKDYAHAHVDVNVDVNVNVAADVAVRVRVAIAAFFLRLGEPAFRSVFGV
jgi:hypothetical protein